MTVSTITDFVCYGCECQCDGVQLRVENNRIIAAENVCEQGRRWLLQSRDTSALPACRIRGQVAPLEAGLIEAAKILSQAKYPLICGLNETTCETQRLAVAIADIIGGCIDHTASTGDLASLLAMQQTGVSTATLGEVRDRGDFILYWGAEPAADSWHFQRYSLDAPSRWLPDGQQSQRIARRTCAVIDSHPNNVSQRAELVLPIPPGSDFETLQILRAIAQGMPLDAVQVERCTGLPLDCWQNLLDRMRAARYGVVFYGERLTASPHSAATLESLFRLVRELNRHTRFVALPLGKAGNSIGAKHVLGWRTGFGGGVNLAAGYPRFGPGEFTAAALLERREADATLVVSGDLVSQFNASARQQLADIPIICLSDRETKTTQTAAVAFFTSTTGLQTSGTVFRADGVPLPLRAAIASNHPSDEAILRHLQTLIAG